MSRRTRMIVTFVALFLPMLLIHVVRYPAVLWRAIHQIETERSVYRFAKIHGWIS